MDADLMAIVVDDYRCFLVNMQASLPQLNEQGVLIDRFKKSRTEPLVHFDGGPNDFFSQTCMFQFHVLLNSMRKAGSKEKTINDATLKLNACGPAFDFSFLPAFLI